LIGFDDSPPKKLIGSKYDDTLNVLMEGITTFYMGEGNDRIYCSATCNVYG